MKKLLILVLVCMTAVGSVFADSNLLFSDSEFIYCDNVVDFSDTGVSENVRSNDFVTSTPADLVVGSVFVDVDNVAKKVTSIETASDGTVYITTIQPSITETLEDLVIPAQDLSLEISDLAATLAEGSSVSADGVSREVFVEDTYLKELNNISDAEFKINDACKIGIKNISGTDKLYLRVEAESHAFRNGFAKINYDHNFGLKFSVVFTATTGNKEYSKNLDLYTVGTSTAGISAGLYTTVAAQGTATVTDTVTLRHKIAGSAGATLCPIVAFCVPYDAYKNVTTNKFYFGNEFNATAEGTVKAGLSIGIHANVLGFSLIDVSLGGGPYAYLKGTFDYDFNYNTLSGDWGVDQDITEDGWHFDSKPTVSATLIAGLWTKGQLGFIDGLINWTFLDTDSPKKTVFAISN